MGNHSQIAEKSLASGERNVVLDVLRGFALLGILMVNFEYLAMPSATIPDYKAVAFPGLADRAAAWLMEFACDGKFILIFSFLFGYGLHVQMTRATSRKESPLPRYKRRLWGLLIIGLLHATLLFVGDILVTYALLGALLIPLRNLGPRKLVFGALICWALSMAGHGVLGWAIAHFPDLAPASAKAILALYRTGSVWEIVAQRCRELVGLYAVTPLLFMPQVMGMFLLGLAAAKTGVLQNLALESRLWKRIFWWCLPVAVVGNALYVSLPAPSAGATDALAIWRLMGRALFTPFGALAYISGLALLLRAAKWRARLAPLVHEGRMSLSNYLGESALCGFLFYSHGFQLFGHIGPADGLILVLMIFGAQLIWSEWWLSKWKLGPLEWLLRSWTEGKWLPLRRPSPALQHSS